MFVRDKELTIRNATPADAHTLGEWWRDGAVMAHAGFPNGTGEKDEDIAARIATDDDLTRRRCIIERDGEPIGEMSYCIYEGMVAEIGIKICRADMQERGYGTRLLRMFISELFGMGATKVILDTNIKNTRAQHVYEKLGFTKVRVNENAWVDQLGEPQTSVDYEMLPGELR